MTRGETERRRETRKLPAERLIGSSPFRLSFRKRQNGDDGRDRDPSARLRNADGRKTKGAFI